MSLSFSKFLSKICYHFSLSGNLEFEIDTPAFDLNHPLEQGSLDVLRDINAQLTRNKE